MDELEEEGEGGCLGGGVVVEFRFLKRARSVTLPRPALPSQIGWDVFVNARELASSLGLPVIAAIIIYSIELGLELWNLKV